MKFPYFLWMSINKMPRGIKSSSKTVQTSIYHNVLIKMLVSHEIKKKDSDWKTFLAHHFAQAKVS